MAAASPTPAADEGIRPRLVFAVLGVHAAAIAAYALAWRDLDAFVLAVDKPSRFQEDFLAYYYEAGARIGREPLPPPSYFYPAFFALLMAPLAAMPVAYAAVAWAGVQAAASCGLALAVGRGLLRLPDRGVVAVAVLVATSYPLLHNLKWGQVSVLVTLGAVAAAAAALRGRSALAGALLGVVAAVKYYPAWFVLWFVLRRQWRAVLAFAAATMACVAVVPALALGVEGWLAYDGAIARGASDTAWVAADLNSQHVPHVVGRCVTLLCGEGWSSAGIAIARGASVLAAGACVFLSWRCVRGGQPALGFAALATALPFLVTTSWPHYFVALVVVQAAAFVAAAAPTARRPRTARVLAVVSAAMASMAGFALAPTWAHYNFVGVPCWANVVALGAVVAASPRRDAPITSAR